MSQLPKPLQDQQQQQQQSQESLNNQHQQSRSPFHHLQQINHKHHQSSSQPQRPQSSAGDLIEANINNTSGATQDNQNQPQQRDQHRDQQQQRQRQQQNQRDFDHDFPAQSNYMPGTASLIEEIDKQLMVILRDGRTLIGYLRSIDQYANLLLSSTIERIHVGTKYGDIPRGVYMIRGENVVLLGEVDFTVPVKVTMTQVSVAEILELQRVEQKKQEEAEKTKKKALLERCLIPHTDAILDEYY